jgi:SRSO17 transposase
MADNFAPSTWTRIRVANGSKGPRVYDWAARCVVARDKKKGSQDLWLLVRRSVARPSEKAYYLAWAPAQTPIATLAGVAANRRPIEECFKESKGKVGLADYQVRQWTPWHRHIELAMLGHLFLTHLRFDYGTDNPQGALSVAEARRLYRIACRPEPRGVETRYQWSMWRREHNRKPRKSHYRNRHRRSSKPK